METTDRTDAETLDALERLVRRADGFALAFARVNSPRRRAELIAELDKRLEGEVGVLRVEVPPETTDLQALLARAVAEATDGVGAVFVTGLDRVLSSARERNGFLPVLNFKRENLQRAVPAPVVLWLPEYALRHIARGAPDVWAWRSGVFEFSAEREELDHAWGQIRDAGSEHEYAQMAPDKRRTRIATLEALYADYGSRTNEPEADFTCISLADRLARLYRYLPDVDEATEWARRVLRKSEQLLGPDDPNTLGAVNNLANLIGSTGDRAAAEPLHHRALAGRERVLGPDHPDTLGSLNNLGHLLLSTGDHTAAEPLLRRALAGRERVLGPDHPDTLTSVNNLASLLQVTGDAAAAEPLLRRALDGRELTLGPDHLDTIDSVDGLGFLFVSAGDAAAAEPFYRRALDGRERVLGPDHPDTLASINNLGALLQITGDTAAAEPLLRRALDGFERVLGPDHPITKPTRENLRTLLAARDAE